MRSSVFSCAFGHLGSFFYEASVHVFCLVFSVGLSFFYWSERAFMYFGLKSTTGDMRGKYLLPHCAILVPNLVFCRTKFLRHSIYLSSSLLSLLLFIFYVCLKRAFWLQGHSYFILGSLLKALLFYTSHLALSSMWSLFCVWCTRPGFACFCIVIRWSSHRLLKILSFPPAAL